MPSLTPFPVTVLPYASLDHVREAIRARRLIRFSYRKGLFRAEPHLLGNAKKTHAFIVCAWYMEPGEGWELFRYAEMRDVEILEDRFTGIRDGFNPYDRRISGIDTCVRPLS
jgi:hypothetical protein